MQTLIFCSFSLSLVSEEENLRDDMIINHRLTPLNPPQHFFAVRYIFILIVKEGFVRAACVLTRKYKLITSRCLYPDFGIGSSDNQPLGHREHFFRA